jgi:hypothetical protein
VFRLNLFITHFFISDLIGHLSNDYLLINEDFKIINRFGEWGRELFKFFDYSAIFLIYRISTWYSQPLTLRFLTKVYLSICLKMILFLLTRLLPPLRLESRNLHLFTSDF